MTALSWETAGHGLPLVMVPGWAMHRKVLAPLAALLCSRHRVSCVDLPGHGSSPSWADWTLEEVAATLAEGIDGPSLWVGWSLGGQVLLELANRFPDKVRGLVLIGTNPRFVATGDWPGMDPRVFENFSAGFRDDTQQALGRFTALLCQGASRSVLRQLRLLWRELPPPAGGDLRRGLEILGQADLRSSVETIEVPVVVVAGEGDALVPREASVRLWAGLPKGRLILLERGGHVPFLVEPDAILDAVGRMAE